MPSCTLRSATEAVPRGSNVYMPGVSAQGGAGLGAGDPQGARGGESCALAWLATCTSARRHLSREHTHGAPPVLQMKDKVAFYAMKTARTMFDTVTGCVAQRAPRTGGGFWHASLRKCWAANQLFGCTSPSHTGRRNPPLLQIRAQHDREEVAHPHDLPGDCRWCSGTCVLVGQPPDTAQAPSLDIKPRHRTQVQLRPLTCLARFRTGHGGRHAQAHDSPSRHDSGFRAWAGLCSTGSRRPPATPLCPAHRAGSTRCWRRRRMSACTS